MNNDEIILKIIKKFNMVPLKNEGGYFTELTFRTFLVKNIIFFNP